MPRATLIICCDQPEEAAAAEAWFARWRSELAFVSPNEGCGCCVDIYNVDGPAEAIAALPDGISSPSS